MAIIKVNDLAVNYDTSGAGPAVLFIHGLGSSTRDWEMQVPFFSKNFQVVTYDVRGHGKSDKPPGPYSVPLFAQDATGLIKALDLQKTNVVGISMGGMIAFQLAIDAPDLINSLVIVNSGPELVIRTMKDRMNLWQRRLIVRLLGMRKMGAVLGGRLFPKPEHEEIRQLFADRWAENDTRAYQDAMNALVGWSVSDRLSQIACPVLVIAADEDYTPISAKEAYVKKLRDAEFVVVPDSRHATPVEHPEVFNQVVDSFLEKHN